MAVKTSNQHHIDPFLAQTGEGSALRLCTPTQIQLNPAKTVEIELESAVPFSLLKRLAEDDNLRDDSKGRRRGQPGCVRELARVHLKLGQGCCLLSHKAQVKERHLGQRDSGGRGKH